MAGGAEATFVSMTWSVVVIVTNSERRSGPPHTRLPATSGVRTIPSSSPAGLMTHMPLRAVHHRFPRSSHFIPSGLPLAGPPVLPMSAWNTRRLDKPPSGATSKAFTYVVSST